jgi:hypothetical protein
VRRPARRVEVRDRRDQAVGVVAVDLVYVPAEGTPARRHRREREHVVGVAEGLLPVQVDQGDEAREPMMRREHRGLPHRALVALRVAQQHEGASRRVLHARRQRGADGEGQPVAERAGREVDPRQDMLGMHAEDAPIPAVAVELRRRQLAAERERGIDRKDGVTFREDEAVPVRVVVTGKAQHPAIERGDQVGHREGGADVADVRPFRLLEHDTADGGPRDRSRKRGGLFGGARHAAVESYARARRLVNDPRPHATFAVPPGFVLTSAAVAGHSDGDPEALEAHIFARYLVDRAPSPDLVERYRNATRAIWGDAVAIGEEGPLAFVRRHPWSVGPLDAAMSLLRPGGYLRAKILTMAAILEASPAFADEFLPRSVSAGALVWRLVAGGLVAGVQAAVGVVLLPVARRARP